MKNIEVLPNTGKGGGFIKNVTIFSHGNKTFRRFLKCSINGDPKDSHYYLQCLASNGSAKCKYETRHKKNINPDHECIFETKLQTLTEFMNRAKDNPTKYNSDSDITLALTNFIAQSGISFSAICSEEFFNLIHIIISKSHEVKELITPESVFPRYTEFLIKKSIHEESGKLISHFLDSLKSLSVAISIDAATVYNSKLIIITCSDRLNSISPHLIKLYNVSGEMTTAQYCKIGKEIIDELTSRDITVNSFTSDGLKAQTNALNYEHPNSIYSQCPEKLYKKVIHNRCGCHLVECALKKTLRENLYLHELKNSIQELITVLRKPDKKAFLKKICPTYSETRWSSLKRVVTWIGYNIKQISEITNEEFNETLGQINMICTILEPFSGMISAFERDNSHISDVFPLVHDAVCYLNSLKDIDPRFLDSNWHSVIDDLTINLLNYTLLSDYGSLYALAYALTPYGREGMMKKHLCWTKESIFKKHRANLSNFTSAPVDIRTNFDFSYRLNDSESDDEQNLQNYSEEDAYTQVNDSSEFQDTENHGSDEIFDEGSQSDLIDELVNESEHTKPEEYDLDKIDWFQIIFSKLESLTEQMDFNDEDKGKLLEGFTLWCCPNFVLPLSTALDSGEISYWRCANRANTKLNELSAIALRVLTIITSEASCERIVSEIRRIVSERRTRLSHKLVFDLLVLSKHRKDKIVPKITKPLIYHKYKGEKRKFHKKKGTDMEDPETVLVDLEAMEDSDED